MPKAATLMHPSTTTSQQEPPSPSHRIGTHIQQLSDWRSRTLAKVRALIRQAVPDVVDAVKWRGVPVWGQAGIICTDNTYKSVVKLTFPKGAALEDASHLFNPPA
jgi:hypothetical protein